jgi:cytoskeletal protein CcmA (bactofilin family)
MELYDKGHFGPGAACEESAAVLFDTRAPFEQWLQLLEAIRAKPEISLSSETETRHADAVHPESFVGTECDVTFEGVLRVDGRLKANIHSADGILVMSQLGRVEADVDVRVALIDGYLEGNIWATEHVLLDSNARVAGNIHSPSLSIKDGAVFEGRSVLLERKGGNDLSEPCEVESKADFLEADLVVT